jgi:5-methylcytosine-specific restriction endonuclease McrA
MTKILALDVGGTPRSWISLNDAITYHAKGNVAWQWGDSRFTARGGYQKNGEQSVIETAGIIAVKAESGFAIEKVRKEVVLSNRTLFGRDCDTCAYCGRSFGRNKLSRDHIHPKSKGGQDVWMNVVTACRDCNCDKDDLTLKEAGMELLYLPYVPNYAEKLLLEGHRILADQMDFLRERLPKNSRLL